MVVQCQMSFFNLAKNSDMFSKGAHSQSREKSWEDKDFSSTAAEAREGMHRATRKKKQCRQLCWPMMYQKPQGLGFAWKLLRDMNPYILKELPFEQKRNQKQAIPVKGRNKSDLMNSDSEIRKHAHMKANDQTVQVMWCAPYSFNSLLLRRLHDIDTGAWKVSYCLKYFAIKCCNLLMHHTVTITQSL